MARVTLRTIADELGVSRMTVSNAFSRPDQLSPALRDRILETAKRLGYAGPDPSGRALARGRTGVVGMVLTEDPRDAFRDDVAIGFTRAVTESLADAGYSLALLHNGAGDVIPSRDVAMDGAIVYACTPQSEAVRHLLERRLPIVRVEGLPIEGIAGVSLDDEAGSAEAAAHLVTLGHREIAIVSVGFDADGDRITEPPSTHLAIIGRRMTGWLRALTAAGIRPRVYAAPGPLIDDALRLRIDHLLDDAPTAVLAFSDLAALEVIERARARGIDVPRSLSVVGFDDNPVAQRISPRLTTVRQDLQRKGELTVAALLQQLEGGRPESPAPLPTELVIRESTAPPPRRA